MGHRKHFIVLIRSFCHLKMTRSVFKLKQQPVFLFQLYRNFYIYISNVTQKHLNKEIK